MRTVEGASERVLGAKGETLLGKPLAEALGISDDDAKRIDERARAGERVEFVHRGNSRDGTWLRVEARVSAAGVEASVVDLCAMLLGAPPVQNLRALQLAQP